MSESVSPTAVKGKRDRSPSFPFIPLKAAIERLELLEKQFGRHPTPADLVGPAWSMKGQSSQAEQTLAALRSYGLITYDGIGPKRIVTISEQGRRYLRAQQESVKEAVRKEAALRPKIIRQFWASWGVDRPTDAVALDTLVLQNGFSENGAKAFLKVYDETVAFAGLVDSDSAEEVPTESIASSLEQPQPQGPQQARRPATLPLEPQYVPLGKPHIVMNGGHLDIRASVDLAGLKQLQTMLKKYEEILALMAAPTPPESDDLEDDR